MPEYMLLIRDGEESSDVEYTPEAIQQILSRYHAWTDRLKAEGKLIDADKLRDNEGRVLRARNGGVVVDGPYTESKEIIGGYYRVHAANYDEAVEIARGCPSLQTTGVVEVREVEQTR